MNKGTKKCWRLVSTPVLQKVRSIAGNAARYHSLLRYVADFIMKVS